MVGKKAMYPRRRLNGRVVQQISNPKTAKKRNAKNDKRCELR